MDEFRKRLDLYGLDIKEVSIVFDAIDGDFCLPVRGEIVYRRYTEYADL